MGALARRHGFVLEEQMTLPSVSASGLYERIRYSREVSAVKAAFLTVAISAARPFFAVLPADIEVWFLRRKG